VNDVVLKRHEDKPWEWVDNGCFSNEAKAEGLNQTEPRIRMVKVLRGRARDEADRMGLEPDDLVIVTASLHPLPEYHVEKVEGDPVSFLLKQSEEPECDGVMELKDVNIKGGSLRLGLEYHDYTPPYLEKTWVCNKCGFIFLE